MRREDVSILFKSENLVAPANGSDTVQHTTDPIDEDHFILHYAQQYFFVNRWARPFARQVGKRDCSTYE